MKILYLSLHPPLRQDKVATGNQVRDAGLQAALRAAGHEILHQWKKGTEGLNFDRNSQNLIPPSPFSVPADVGAVIVGYWQLLEDLPEDGPPVVLDFIAPRLLEAMYQDSGAFLLESRQLLRLLPRADHFLVGNRRQADLLLGLLLLCGFECRDRVPISILPISVSGTPAAFSGGENGIALVSSGVDWPWRQSRDYLDVLRDYCGRNEGFRLLELSGSYPGSGEQGGGEGLASYRDMRHLLSGAQIGLELGRRNTEREFSHSFRLADYLQCGLPVIVNRWLPAAAAVLRCDAGWAIDEPAELVPLLDRLAQDPAVLREKAAGAQRLATTELNYAQSCRPLLSWLAAPWRPRRRSAFRFREETPAQPPAAAPPAWKRLRAAMAEVVRLKLGRQHRPGILVVTRADLFPPDHGAAVKILETARALSRQGREVILCTDERRRYFRFREGEMEVLRYPFWTRLPPLAWPRPLVLLRLLLRGMPSSNAFLYFPLADASYILRTLYLAARHPLGAWLAEFPAYVRPLRFARELIGGRLLLVEHNVEYERIREQVPSLGETGYRYLKAVELRMCAAADAVVTVSENDRLALVADGAELAKLHTIPHGVDLESFRRAGKPDLRARYGLPTARPVLVYHGTYSYPPNLEAMQVMARELLPRLRARGLEVSVLAIGSKPPQWPLDPAIHFTGSVDSLAEVLPGADIAVVPLLSGGGTRMKILDYFAAGVPVISTAKGIEGIPVEHGREALVLDGFDEICDAAARLLRERDEAARLAANAREFVEELGWDAIARRYLPLLFE